MRLPRRRIVLALSVCLSLPIVGLSLGLSGHGGASSGFALAAAPPPPPTFVPTPIGAPPGPPTAIPTATAVPPPTASPSTTPVAETATATVAPTAKPVEEFSLDAARVSRINNPGNLQGLATVTPGSHVWLMMYYTVHVLPRTEQRVTTYWITARGHTVYKVTYRTPQKVTEQGRFSRYTIYLVPTTLPFGVYYYHADLSIGGIKHQKTWKFTVGKRERVATAHTGR